MLFIVLTFNLMAGLQLTDCFEWVCESCLRKASSYILCGSGIWSWLKGILGSTGNLVGVDKLKNFGNLHITIQFLLKNSSVLWCFRSSALHRKRRGWGKGNYKHRACEICKSLIFLLHKSRTVQQVPRVQGQCNSSSHQCHTSMCSYGLQLKILPAQEGCRSSCPRCHW